MYASRKHAMASGMIPSTSRGRSDGRTRSGNPGGNTPTRLNPIAASGVSDSATIEAATTSSATGRPGNSFSPADQQCDCDQPEGEHRQVRVADLRSEDPESFEEVLPTTLHAEQLRQLGHRDGKRSAGLETEQDRLADEIHQRRKPAVPTPRRSSQRRSAQSVRRSRPSVAGRRPPCRSTSCPRASRSPKSARSRADAMSRATRTRVPPRDSNRCRIAEAGRRAWRRPARPGWHRRPE